MTKEEYIRSLVDQNIPGDKMFELVKQWEIDNPQTEEVVEEVVEEGKQNDSQPEGADVDQDNAAPQESDTESTSEDGSLESASGFSISSFLNEQRDSQGNISGLTLGELNARLEPEQNIRDVVSQYEKMTIVAKPEETYTEGNIDYKYNFTEDGPMYYAKEKGSENWIITDEDSDAYLNIQSLFGHNGIDRKKFAQGQQTIKGENQNNLYSELKKASDSVDAMTNQDIDPSLKYVEDIYNQEVLLNDRELNGINKQARDYFITGGNKKVSTGQNKMRQKYTRASRDKDFKEQWDKVKTTALEQIATEKKIPVSEIDLRDPETSKLFEEKFLAIKTDKLIDAEEQAKMIAWIDSLPSDFNDEALGAWIADKLTFNTGVINAKHVWDRNQIQKDMESFKKGKSKDFEKENEAIGEFVNKAYTSLDMFSQSFELIRNGEYQTPDQVARAKKQLIQLDKQRKEVVELIKKQYAKLEDPERIDEIQDVDAYLGALERNYSLIPNMIAQAEKGGLEMLQGIEEIGFQVANLPNNIYEETGININKYSPMFNMAGKYLVNAWGQSRDKANKNIEEYKKQIMGDVAENLRMDDIRSADQWGRYLMQTIGSVAPQMGLMVTTGAAGVYLVTAGAGGGKFRQYQGEMDANKKEIEAWQKSKPKKQEGDTDEFYQDQLRIWNEKKPGEINYSIGEMWGGALVSMGAEYAGSKLIAMPMINRAKAFTGFGVKAGFTSAFAKRLLASTYTYAGDLISEGTEEVFAEGAGNLYDRLILGKDVNVFDGWKDNFFSGIVMANGFKAPALFSPYINAAQTPGDKSNILGKQNQIKDIVNTIFQNPKMSQKTKSLLEGDMVDLTVDINNDLVNIMNRYNDMPRTDIDALGNIEQQTYQLNQQIEAVKNDEGITVGKDALLEKLNNKKNELSGLKNELLEPYVVKNAEGRIIGGGNLVLPTARVQQGADVVAEQLGDVGITRFDSTEDLLGGIETLKAEGIKLEVETNEDGSIKDAKDQGYGLIATLPNGTQQVIINNASSEAEGVLPADKHEILHAFASKMEPAKLAQMGKDLKAKLDSDPNIKVDAKTDALLKAYEADLESGKITEATFYEEVMAVTSDALTSGGITVTQPGKLQTFLNKFLETIGWKQSFKDGDQVIDFLKGFNRDVMSGKGLSQQTLDKADVKLDTQVKTEVDSNVAESKKLPAETETYMELDNDMLQQGLNDALQNKTDQQFPIAQAIVEKNWPLISKSLDINSPQQMDAAKEVVIDQILGQFEGSGQGKYGSRNTSALSGFSLEGGAQVSTYLTETIKKRKPEIDLAIKERTGSSSELNTNTSEEVASVTTETLKPKAKKSPKGDAVYSSVLAENLGSDVATSINTAIETDLESMNVGDRFGNTKNIGPKLGEVLGKMFGLDSRVFTDKSWNIKQGDLAGLTNLKQYLNSNAINDFKLLPDAYNSKGKSNFIPDNILNKLYTKDGKNKWKKDTSKTIADYKALLGEMVKPVYRAAEATTIKGLAGLSFRNKIFETAVPNALDRVDTGVKFSKKKITIKNNEGKKQLEEISQARDINKSMKIIDPSLENKVGVTLENKIEKQEIMQKALEDHPISEEAFLNSRFSNFGRKKVNDVYIDEPAKGSLYFGTKDPAYQTALAQVRANDIKSGKKPQRVNANTAGTSKANTQSDINIDALESVALELETAVKNGMPIELAALFISSGYQATTGLVKISAKFVGESTNPQYAKEGKDNQRTGKYKWREEHSPPASVVGASIIWAIKNGQVKQIFPFIKQNYIQVKLSKADDVKIDRAGLDATLPEGVSILTPNAGIRRFAASDINLNTIKDFKTGKTFADIMNVGVTNKASKKNPNIIYAQNSLISEQITSDLDGKTTKARIKAYEPIADLEFKASKKNTTKFGDKVNNEMTVADQLTMLGVYDKAASVARKLDTPKKGISVFDFDDTLAKTKEKVIVNNSDGTTTELSAAQFAEQASNLEAEGATFDFSNFDNVVNAKKGPLADLALKRQDKFGSKDIFVLTARPQIAAQGIKTFLDGIGLNLPLSNITGLENGTPGAKGNWVASKAAEGYNDFYFADDAYKNVQAVQEVLSQIDVNSVVQIAKSSKKVTFDKIFNNILESSTGIESYKEFSAARAQTIGANKGKFTFFNTPSAEDFTGLLYKTLGKGKIGDAQMAFYKTNLLDPYNRAELAVTKAKITAAADFKALKSNLKTLPKSLSKQTGIGGFTFSQASRVAAWTRQNMEIPGLSKRDVKELNNFVDNNAELNTFVDELIKIQKGKPYPKPGKNWLGGTITSDILNEINKVNRKAYLQEWQENVDIIFSDKNMNKLEAAYGPNYVEALRDQLTRMKSGSNRPIGGSRVVNNVLDWLNNSVGAVMFLNTRSAVLQTLSAVNFINFGNNNIYKAGKAFANQPQFWKDFKTLMNSPYLVERRNGLKINVSESEIADAVAEASNKPKAAISYLLNKGFILTRIADSFAIAAGGSAFYRNQIDAYVKNGMDQKAAEKQAFDDFYAIAEENQQSSNPSKISQQQASGAGRVILAFANTPMQYARIIKRSSQDLINNRGDWKTNVSKIVYYAAIQNIAFNALQNALFAQAFGEDEDEEKDDKTGRIANGMADSLLRGLGIQGAAVSALKNSLITLAKENDKDSPKFVKAVYDLFDFSPPLDSKFRKLRSAANTFTWERENIKNKGFNLNNPAYLAGAQVISGLTNIPMDRAIQKMNNIRAIMSNSSQNWQKVAMALGWSTWDVGLPYYGVDDKVEMTPQMILKEKVTTMKKETSTKQQKEMLLELGLTKQQIKALKYEETRIKKILELQEKNKK